MPGVTRDVIIELAENAGLNVEQTMYSEQELIDASEIWVTSSTKEIVPVISLNNRLVSNGVPGAVWKKINSLFQSHKQDLM